MTRSKLCILLAALLISSAPDAPAAETQFRPEQFFAGRTRSSGVFVNTFGKPRQRFTTECRGRRRGDTLWLDQTFRYDDGRTQKRRWQIRRLDAVHYVGRANDVVGEARGKVDGATFQFAYTVALKPGSPLFHVRLDQTMTLQRDGTVENRATIRKLGIVLSRVTERFRRADVSKR
jgi:hypothetical protein